MGDATVDICMPVDRGVVAEVLKAAVVGGDGLGGGGVTEMFDPAEAVEGFFDSSADGVSVKHGGLRGGGCHGGGDQRGGSDSG